MKNVITIMSKEFTRFFTDKRMVAMTLMPAVLIYVIYSLMGSTLGSVFEPSKDHEPLIYSINTPESISQMFTGSEINIINSNAGEINSIKDKINEKEADLLIIFPADFDEMVAAQIHNISQDNPDTQPAPNIEIYYNATEPNSHQTYITLNALFDVYKNSLVNIFSVAGTDLASQEDFMATVISTLMPMLLMLFLYSGCMALALESITGEKERGTLATLLVSPLKRSELAAGKILSLAVLSFLSGIITAAATILSLPNLMGGEGGIIDVAIYSIVDYMLLACVILSVLLLMVVMLSIVSAFARTVKEAGQAATPLMILVMVVGISGMFGAGSQTEAIYYMIPLYGSVQSMSGIFSFEYSTLNVTVACLSALLYACLGGFILTKMFNSEKVMFSR